MSIKKANIIFIFLFGVYIFILPMNGMTAIKEIGFYGSLVFFIYLLYKGSYRVELKGNYILFLMTLFLLQSLLSIYLSQMDVSGSLNAIRKTLLEQIYIFIACLIIFQSTKNINLFLKIVVASYFALVYISLVEIGIYQLNHPFNLSYLINHDLKYHSGFAAKSSFLFIVAFGYGLFAHSSMSKIKKMFFWSTIFIATLLLIRYGSEAITVFTFFVIMALLSYKFIYLKYGLKPLIIMIFFIFFILPVIFYASGKKFSDFDITNDQALSARVGIWKINMFCIKDSLLMGYGYGWKKNYEICRLEKNREYIESNYSDMKNIRDFFLKNTKGSVNPHNGYVQLLMTNGIVGLLLFMSILIFILYFSIRSKHPIAFYIIIPTLISYILNNTMNGYMDGSEAKLLFLLAAISYVLFRNRVSKNS